MPIKLHISPRLVKSVSSLYNDPNRIFMEYIDNSLDSAGHWFSDESVGYTRPIEITLKIEGKNKKDGRVTIADNCFGITNFKKQIKPRNYNPPVGKIYCPKCGKKIDDDSKYCIFCGAKVH